jgi:HD superfamily phosphodiesterase
MTADLSALLARLPRPDPAWFRRPDGRDGSRGIHGVGHTVRVMVHAVEIAEALGVAGWERESLTLAALWHDIGRTDDGADDYHGAKSAGKVVGLGLHPRVDRLVLDIALYAVTHHSGSEDHGERAARRLTNPSAALRVFRMLKDADGLDRVRLGDLDPRLLRLPPSLLRLERAQALIGLVR